MDTLTRNKSYKAIAGAVFAFLVCAGSFTSTSVHADFGDLAGAVDYIMAATGEDAEELAESPVAGWILMLHVFQDFYYETQYDIAANNGMVLQEMSGLYINENGEEKFATLCLTGNWTNPSSVDFWCPVLYSDDFGIYVTVPGGGSCNISYDGASSPARLNITGSSSFLLQSNSESYLAGSVSGDSIGLQARPFFTNSDSYLFGTGLASRFKKWASSGNTSPTLKNPTPVAYDLPPSDDMTFANLDEYIQGDFRDYIIQYYPEYIYLLPDEEDETGAFDPLEFPPYIPDVDFHDVEVPSETLPTGLTDGAGFWFSAFSTMVDAFNLKSFVILFLCIMLVMVILKI